MFLVCRFTHYGVYLVHFKMSKTSYICKQIFAENQYHTSWSLVANVGAQLT
jgi:hypothetical protein